MEINQKLINEIVNILGLKPDKDLGQNFLIDAKVSERIANSIEATNGDILLEVGGGLGSITHFLSGKASKFDVIDLDDRMCRFLSDTYSEKDVNVLQNDVRKIDVSSYNKIIGNLPYYITTELVTFLLLNSSKCEKFVFMVQSEASERFVATSGKEYGAISVLTHLLGTPKKLFSVKAGSFYPMPKCGSTVFEITVTCKDREKAIKCYKLTKQLFLNRRKTILNNLTNYTKNKEISQKTLKNLGILETTRPEEIPPETFIKMLDELKKYNF